MKDIKVGYGVDIDAVAGWIGSYGGEDSPDDITRGIYAGKVGIPRLLKLFRTYNIKATWFTPGQSAETFPDECKQIVEEGHELGLHGYSHENPLNLTREQEEKVLVRSKEILTSLMGKEPTGYVAPWWELSPNTIDLLQEYGAKYDHSLMHHDFQCYYAPTAETIYPIDYDIEIPANWYLDDLPPMMFIKKAPNSFGWVSPDVILQLWKDQFDFMYREYDDAVFPMTIHPDVSGRPQCIIMHEKLIEYINKHPGVRWCRMAEMAEDFASKNPK
jgi:peptidoglycan/xylan/chitin deacetylase (PgdA/CDA1 family)